jgi:hypothetical protein
MIQIYNHLSSYLMPHAENQRKQNRTMQQQSIAAGHDTMNTRADTKRAHVKLIEARLAQLRTTVWPLTELASGVVRACAYYSCSRAGA